MELKKINLQKQIASLAEAGTLSPSLRILLEGFSPASDSPHKNPFEKRKGRLALALTGENVVGVFKLDNKVVIETQAIWETLPQQIRFLLSLHSLMVSISEAQLTQVLSRMLSKEILLNISQFSNGDAYMSFSDPTDDTEKPEAKKSDKRRRS